MGIDVPNDVKESSSKGKEVVIDSDELAEELNNEVSNGQNDRVRLLGTTLRVPEENPKPWPNKLPRQLENVHGGSMSAWKTSSTKGQKFGLRRGLVANSSISKFNFQNMKMGGYSFVSSDVSI
ncbi:hypothetical protein MTR67_007038 [Solanum verrucosum]|uniref:Uncharacterized protein n=1 Tax=Solanum verrucosum TaxID=315347 RepID=A0AAF0PZG0_SOLVR|nr:hypothetical protein MTR67_007038 [Solanum verrucosum]